MEKIKIITDSASDIGLEDSIALDIDIIPIHLFFGEEEYKDGVNLTKDKFYEMLTDSKYFPKTSQINPHEYEEVFNKYKDCEIIYIAMSSKLSGSIQSAAIAAKGRENVHIVDSLNACIAQGILVRYAVSLREKCLGAKEIVRELEIQKNNIRLVALLDTLEYLKKGGRISAAAATIGTALAIKVAITIENGEVEVLGKARGSKKGQNHLTETIEKDGGIDFYKPYFLAYSGLTDELLREYVEGHAEIYEGRIKKEDLNICQIGSIIGTYAGPGAIGIAYFKGNKN